MAATDLRTPSRPSTEGAQQGLLARDGLVAVVTATLTTAALVLVVLPGAREHVTTGAALLGVAAGWASLAALARRRAGTAPRWAVVPAAFFAASAAGLLALAPGDGALSALAWVWPPVVLGLLVWAGRQARATVAGGARWPVYAFLAVLGLACAGALVQDVAGQQEAPPAPGALYDVGGRRLHLQCTGSGAPTVVLESGLGGSSPLWARVTQAVAPTTRVCAYDRAGTGWSDDAPSPQDGQAVAADLHALLARSGEPGPYVLVGHSVGGAYVLTYAERHPDQLAGVVLLDSASPRQFEALPAYPRQYAALTRLYGVLPSLTRLGVGRLVPVLTSNDVPGAPGRQARALSNEPRNARTARDELSTYRRTFAQAQRLTTLGSTPLVVLSAGDSLDGIEGWAGAQQQLAALSRKGALRSVRSSHVGLLEDAVASRASATAVLDVVRAVRDPGSPLTS